MASYIIAGATGLIGSELTKLLSDPTASVTLLTRRPLTPALPHQQVIQTDLLAPEIPPAQSDRDAVFCALGTTIKTAGSKSAFSQVDHDMVVAVAQAAKLAGYDHFVVISSLGVRSGTRNFYLQTKHRMEQSIADVGFNRVTILRPSLLLGSRDEFRLGESIGAWLSRFMAPLFIGALKKYRPIAAQTVAQAMLISDERTEAGLVVLESDAIARIAAKQ
jgi:uncharacterized protein YbjT (DUF2867 family)